MNDAQVDALLKALGMDGADELLAEMLGDGTPDANQVARTPKEIRARVKELAGKNPEKIVKIITHWLNEERRRK